MIKNIYLKYLYCCKMITSWWWRGSESKQHKSGQRHIPTQGHKVVRGALIREAAEMGVQKADVSKVLHPNSTRRS